LFAPSNTVIVLLASAAPVRTSTCVLASVAADVDATSVGAVGACVSIVTARAVDATLVPPEVVAVAVKEWPPSDSAVVVSVQAPLEFAVTVPSTVEPSSTFTVLPATAEPVSVNVLSLVMWSPTTPLSVVNEVIAGGGVEAPDPAMTALTACEGALT
jgi:hypothetical protein